MGISATIRCATAGTVLAAALTASAAPAMAGGTQTPSAIGNYIVTLESGAGDVAARADDQLGLAAEPGRVFESGTITGTGPCVFVIFCVFPETPNLLVRTSV